jgi:hypothetical protein
MGGRGGVEDPSRRREVARPRPRTRIFDGVRHRYKRSLLLEYTRVPVLLALRMKSDFVDKLDGAWRHQGLHWRIGSFRKSLRAFLQNAREADVAAILAGSNA